MASEREDFSFSGPLHLTAVDWTNTHHRRSVAASLVQGVYILERDRQLKRLDQEALANPWWEFFHFQLLRKLVDDVDSSMFGAIYEFKPPTTYNHALEGSPRYVIAFRGTLTKPDSLSRDLELDLQIIRHGLHETSRFEIAMQAVRNIVATVGESNVWLAGHSLGAAMALLAGKTMAKTGVFIEAFLFNPPFFSAPIERIKDKRVKHGLRIAGSMITAGLAFAATAKKSYENRNNNNLAVISQQNCRSIDVFSAVSAWIPCLYVNPGDHLCSEYIGYFEHRKKMEDIGIGAIERLATQTSISGLIMSAMGKESEPIHLIPSANLTINLSPSQDFKEAHGIHQWWRPDLDVQSKLYKY